MATIKEIFISAVNNAMTSAQLITEHDKKANAYANIAQALAISGLLKENIKTESKESLKVETYKEPLVQEDNEPEQQQEVKEEVQESKVEKVAQEEEQVLQEEVQEENEGEEWTEELGEKYATEITYINEFAERHGEDKTNECIATFFENTEMKLDNITPLNVKGVYAFLKSLEEDANQ